MRVVVGKGNRRNGVLACGARDSQILDALAAGHACSCGLEVVGYLRVVGLKTIGPIHRWCFEQLHVARALYSQFQRYRFVGLHLGLRDVRRKGELPYASCKPRGFPFGQLLHMYSCPGGFECLGYVGIGAEEVIEDTAHLRTILHAEHCLEGSRVDLYVARVLGVEQRAVEHSRLVVSAVVVLQLGLYLSLLNVLLQEAGELGYLRIVGELRHIHAGEIEFVREQDGFLLVDACFAEDGPDEEVLRGDTSIGGRLLRGSALLCVAALRCACSRLFIGR